MRGRAVVTVATGRYLIGAKRLRGRLQELNEKHLFWFNELPAASPPHKTHPYGFKAAALDQAAEYYDTMLWADACIYPLLPLDRIWDRAERTGAWIANNGFRNVEWTADAAYPALGITRAENEGISHVVATAFAISLRHSVGRSILREYSRICLRTDALRGPWMNSDVLPMPVVGGVPRIGYCGGPEVLGHRHDQTVLSVIAWRLGVELTQCPDFFGYGKIGEPADPRTILLADGAY
jgi:hypothetical protein